MKKIRVTRFPIYTFYISPGFLYIAYYAIFLFLGSCRQEQGKGVFLSVT